MLVCVCNGISDRQIDSAMAEGVSSFSSLKKELGIGNCCGQCVSFAKDMFSDKIASVQSNNFHLAQEVRC